jgi:hypothetical protein
MATGDFQVSSKNDKAPFTLKLHRGDGMCLVAMNWKKGKPPNDFVDFAIESKPPDGKGFSPEQSRRVPDQRRRAQSASTLDAYLADPEMALGAFPAQRQSRRRISVSGDTDIHGRRRQT